MDDYVSKPIQREELQRVLGTINGAPALVSKEEANATVFSHADLLEQCDGDAELAEQLIELFRDDAPRLLDVIQGAAARRDAAGVAAGAHKLVGSLGAFGAANARVIVSQLATVTAAANFEQLNEQVEKLARELDLIQAILAGYLLPSGSLLPGSGAGLRSRAVTAENEYAAV
jgi:HPt (histidine-containing phosphotransfer) domain-containing protein